MAELAARFDSAWQRREWEALAKELEVRVRDAGGDDWLPTPHGLTLARAIVRILQQYPQAGRLLRLPPTGSTGRPRAPFS